MKRLNEILLERKVDAQYVTLTLLSWNPRKRELTLANAGALPPLLCRGGERIKVQAEGIPLGLLENREYDEVTVKTMKGDAILLYSDGVADQLSRDNHEYGTTRLFKALRSVCDGSAAEIVKAVFEDLDGHTDGAPMTDDQTLLAARVQ
jgi:sigma-B regulation protein RsbU (phosphoserine phosphatase)